MKQKHGMVSGLAGDFGRLEDRIAELRESNEVLAQFKATLDMTKDCVFMFHPDTLRFIYVNQGAMKQVGYSEAEMFRMTPLDIKPEFEEPAFRELIRPLLSGEVSSQVFETLHRHNDGQEIPVEIVLQYISEIDTDPRFVAIVRDITERKQAEKQLWESELRFRNLIEGAVYGIFIHRDLKFLFVNQSLAQTLGYERPGEMIEIGKVLNFYAPHERERLRAYYEERKSGGSPPVRYEVQGLRTDGSFVWLENHLQMVHWEGQPAALGMVVDIEKRKTAELALMKSEENLKLAQSIAHLGSWERDLATDEMRFSDEFRAILGDPDAAPHEAFFSTLHPEEKEEILAQFAAAIDENKPYHLERRVMRPDGEVRWVEERAEVLRSPEGAPLKMLGTALDITENRKLEEQLRRAQKLEAVGHLAGGIAHEFNNLLQIISGYSELALTKTPESDDRHKNLKEILDTAERGANLVKQILGFSRQQSHQPSQFDVNTLISSTVEGLRGALGEQIETGLELEPALKVVHADKGAIQQVLMNLWINARDAIERTGSLTIETRNTRLDGPFCQEHPWARPGEYVRISTVDSGVGMSSETLERVFEPFFTTKGPQEGSGLGLSMVYGIIERHNGLIDVTSQPGEGTRVDVYLPVAMEQVQDAEESKSQPMVRGSGTILVAEDEKNIRYVTTKALQEAGYTVLSASDGEEAVRVFDAQCKSIDLVLLDFAMPRLGGQQVYHHIKAKQPDMPVMFHTGHESGEIDKDFIAATNVKTLQKPYSLNILLQTVADMMAAGI